MEGVICASCHSFITAEAECPGCGTSVVREGEGMNVIDRLQPDCLIHRYNGSDMLEPAVIVKVGKTNIKVATRLREYAHPVTVPKAGVYSFDPALFGSIQALRNERTAAIRRYELLIGSHWQRLKPLGPER